MSGEKWLIDASHKNVKAVLEGVPYYPDEIWKFAAMAKRFPPVGAVEVVRIEEVKQEILQQMDMFIAEYDRIGFYGKSDVMDIAKRLVNAALTDLAKIDGGNENA